MLSSHVKAEAPEVAMEVAEVVSWAAADYAWDPHRLIAVQDSSSVALHVNTTAGGTQPDSLVPPVLGATFAPSERSVSPSACCKVEGCQHLLMDEKPYYQRFGVCEDHMRSLAITVDGALCRFCQQCAKFEPVEAFDGIKRSCRARLLEHNKRRRKLGVNQRSLRKPRRNTPASSKSAYQKTSACSADTRSAAAEPLPTGADAAIAGAAGIGGEGDDAGATLLGETGHCTAETEQAQQQRQQQQQQQVAAGAGSASSRVYALSGLATSGSGSLSAPDADGSNSKLQQRQGSSRSCVLGAAGGSGSSGDGQLLQHAAACENTAAGCIDMSSLLLGQPASAGAAAGGTLPARRTVPCTQHQEQQAGCTLAVLVNQDQLPDLCASPNLSELMTEIGLDMAADAETAVPMDHMLAPLAAPLLPANPAAAPFPAKLQQLQPAAVAAAAATKLSSAAGAATAHVDTGGGGSGSASVLSNAGRGGSNSAALVQHIAAAVASIPGLPLGCSLEAVEQLSPTELLQWQQMLRLEGTVYPAGSQQRKQQEAAAEAMGLLAAYKQGGKGQQQQLPGLLACPPASSGLLPKLHELQLQPKLSPNSNSEQLLENVAGWPLSGAPAAAAAATAAAAGTDCGLGAAASHAVLWHPCAAPSLSTTTSMNTAGSGCCAHCGCSMCTCRFMPGQRAAGWMAAPTNTSSGYNPNTCTQADAAAAAAATVAGPESSSQVSDLHGLQQLRKRRSEALVPLPSDVHAMRRSMLSVDLLPSLSVQASASLLHHDSAEGYQGIAAGSHKLRRQGSPNDAVVTSDKASMQRKASALSVQQQSAGRQRLVERQLQEQQRQLEAMQMMHAQGSKMLPPQQSQQQQQQQPAHEALTAQELEDIEVDLELQQLLLVAQMQVSLSSLDDGSSDAPSAVAGAAAAGAAAAAGSYTCYGDLGQQQQQQQLLQQGWSGLGATPAYGSMPACMFNAAPAQQAGFAAAGQQQQAQLLQQLMLQQQQQQQFMAQQQQQQMMLQQQMALCATGAAAQSCYSAGMGAATGAAVVPNHSQAFSLDAAMQIAQGGGMHASYMPMDTSMRLSMKVHNATPAQLQPGMHSQLNSMLGAAGAAVESGFMRPGCVHLVLQVRAPLPAPPSVAPAVPGGAPAAAAAAAAANVLSRVVAGLDGSDWAHALTGGSEQLSVTVQLPNHQVLLVRSDERTKIVNLEQQQQPALPPVANTPCTSAAAVNNSAQLLCRVDGLAPGCISSTDFAEHGCAALLAVGMGLAQQGTCVLARMQGMFLPAEVLIQPYSRRNLDAPDAVLADCVGVRLQRLQPYGLVHVEFQQGLLLSEAKPLLVVDSAEVAAELQGLLQCVQQCIDGAAAAGSSSSSSSHRLSQLEVEHLLTDFGRLLDFRAVLERHRSSRVLEQAADNDDDAQQPTTAAAASLAVHAAAVSVRRQQGSGSRAAATAAATRQRERRQRDIDDSAHEGLPLLTIAASAASAAALPLVPASAAAAASASSGSFENARNNNSSSSSSSSAAGQIEPAPASCSTAAGTAADAAAATLNAGGVNGGTRHVGNGSVEDSTLNMNPASLLPLAAAAPVGRRTGLQSLATLSLASGSSSRVAAKPTAAPAAPANGGIKSSGSSFGSAAAAATRRLKDRLSFTTLVRNRSFFSSGRRGAAAAAADALVPAVRCDSGSSSCGGSFFTFSAHADTRRCQSLDLRSSRSTFLAALRRRSCRLGDSGSKFRPGEALASPALRRNLDGPAPGDTSRSAVVLQQQRHQWQEQQLACELRLTPEVLCQEDGDVHGGREQQPQQQARAAAASGRSTAGDEDIAVSVADAVPSKQQQQAPEQEQQQHAPEQEQQQQPHAVAEENGEDEDMQLPLPSEHPLLGPEYIGCMMDVGVRLLCFFVDRGFPASAQMVLDTLLTCAAPAASFPTLARAAGGTDGLGLLHRAVRSGSTAMVLAVMGWGVQHRHCFAWDAPGPLGLTPLHLAALLGKQERPLAALALQSSPGLAAAWFSAKADNGVTPAMYATTMGLAAFNKLAHNLLQQQAAEHVQAQRHTPWLMRMQQQRQQSEQVVDTQLLRDQQQQAVLRPASHQENAVRMAAAMQQGDVAVAKQQQPPAVTAVAGEQQTSLESAQGPLLPCIAAAGGDHCQGAVDRLPRQNTAAATSSTISWDHAAAAAAAGGRCSQECGPLGHAVWGSGGSCHCSSAAAVVGFGEYVMPAGVHPAATAPATFTKDEDIEGGVVVTGALRPDSFSGSEATALYRSIAGSDSSRSSLEIVPAGACWEHAAPNKQQQQDSLRAGSSSSCCSSSSAAAASQAASGWCVDASVESNSSREWEPNPKPLPVVFGDIVAPATVDEGLHGAAAVAPGAAAAFTEECLLSLCSELHCKPWLRLTLLAFTVTLQLVLALLLLASLLRQAHGLLLFCALGLLGLMMLQRLLAALVRPPHHSSRSRADAASLKGQLQLLMHCSTQPLLVPHNRWTLVFNDARLEDCYLKVLADSRLTADAALSASIKTAVSLLPLAVRIISSSMLSLGSNAAHVQQQQQQLPPIMLSNNCALPLSHQLAGVVAGGLPLAAVLFSPCSYHTVRDSVLSAVQSLLLVVMRKPLLLAAAAASAGGSGAAAAHAMACYPALFHSCSAAVLLLVFQQRLSWAGWQVLWDVAACMLLAYADRSCQLAGSTGAAVQGLWQVPMWGWAQMLLPLLMLPLLYVCEHIDRSMFLLSLRKGKQSKSL